MTSPIPEKLVPFATRFEFEAGGLLYTIERYDNHGNLLPDGRWCVAVWLTLGSVPNVHYLGADGKWRYKAGYVYASAADAWAAYNAAEPPK